MTFWRWVLVGSVFTVVMGVLVFVLALLSAAADADHRIQQEHESD